MTESESKQHPRTRNSTTIFGVGPGITDADQYITGSRLPTCKQVLRCYLFHQQQGLKLNRTKRETAKIVLNKIIPFYEKGNIPMITEKKACEKINVLIEKNARFREVPIDRRSSSLTGAKLRAATVKLSETFPLWAKNAESMIKNAEDVEFLKSMKTDRAACFGSLDNKTAQQIKRKAVRLQKYEVRRHKVKLEPSAVSRDVEYDPSSSSDDDSCSSENDYECCHAVKLTEQSVHRTGSEAFVPCDILKRPKLVSLATRINMTPAQQACFTKAVIEECQADTSTVSLSYATADRSRRSVNEDTAAALRHSWVPPQLSSIHWDSKLMPGLTKNISREERLVVAVGDNSSVKILGVPSYKPITGQRSGDIIAQLSMQLLDSWNCNNSIINMTFDTTASNTGHVSAACITLQQSLGRALLWSACRHHVGEVILTQVFNDMNVETSKSAEYAIFSRFQKHFDIVPHTNNEILSPFDDKIIGSATNITLIKEWQEKTMAMATTVVQHQREDYKEFTELCLMYLNYDSRSTSFRFHRPAALHKARWMAKLLYSIKMVLLEKQIQTVPKGIISTSVQQKKLRAFVDFVCLIYCKWWITCSSNVDAPWHDICLYKDLLKYDAVNSGISASALKALKRHLWYLCPEMIPLALFSDIVPKDELQYLSRQLLTVQPANIHLIPSDRYGTGFGKPKFPENITLSTRLGDLVSPDSWFTVRILQMNTDFLTEDVESWPAQPSFISSKVKTRAINVINDSAERGVKLSSDFLNAARSEEHYQNILQVVEDDRRRTPNLRRINKN